VSEEAGMGEGAMSEHRTPVCHGWEVVASVRSARNTMCGAEDGKDGRYVPGSRKTVLRAT
jgi:hypothetical protein